MNEFPAYYYQLHYSRFQRKYNFITSRFQASVDAHNDICGISHRYSIARAYPYRRRVSELLLDHDGIVPPGHQPGVQLDPRETKSRREEEGVGYYGKVKSCFQIEAEQCRYLGHDD